MRILALVPAFVTVLRHAQLPAGLTDRLALAKQHFRFTQLADDLLRRIPLPAHPEKLLRSKKGAPGLTQNLDSFSGGMPA